MWTELREALPILCSTPSTPEKHALSRQSGTRPLSLWQNGMANNPALFVSSFHGSKHSSTVWLAVSASLELPFLCMKIAASYPQETFPQNQFHSDKRKYSPCQKLGRCINFVNSMRYLQNIMLTKTQCSCTVTKSAVLHTVAGPYQAVRWQQEPK
jgi:hypothetical protein